MLTEEQVRHVAKLARLELSEAEVEKYVNQLSTVLDYFEILNEVDTTEVEPTYQVTGLENVSQIDEVESPLSRDELLDCSSLPKELNQIRVKAVITSE